MGKRGRNLTPKPNKAYTPDAALAGRIRAALSGETRTTPELATSFPLPASSSGSVPTAAHSVAVASTQFVPSRTTAPHTSTPGRASFSEALAVADSAETKLIARTNFEHDKSANSSRASQATLWRTWQGLHKAWFRDTSEPLPLTPEKIACVASMFKAGKYVSFGNYMGRAKAEHIATFESHKCPWTEELSVAIRNASRSVTRGLGASRQSSPLDVHRVHSLQLSTDPVVPGGPISPTHFATLGIFFLAREAEITCAAWADVSIDESRSEITWRLPVSKTDPRALGTSRTWGCVCACDRTTACPFHSALEHAAVLDTLATRLDRLPSSLPWFPDAEGNEVSKYLAVSTITELAKRSGAAVTDAYNRNLFGGHSLRTGGAVTLAGLGLDAARIECLARWSSPMLLHYARLAPLKTLTSEYIERTRQGEHSASAVSLSSKLEALQATVAALARRLDRDGAEVDIPITGVGLDIFVLNCKSSIWHLSTVHNMSLATGVTVCKWEYSHHSSFTFHSEPKAQKGKVYCNRCLPRLAKLRNKACREQSSDTSSS